MHEARFHSLSPEDRREALEVASARTGRRVQLLEKDIWVVGTLEALFSGGFGGGLTFKGGTSLSKAYNAINRFSEDLDITYDIRRIAPDFMGDDSPEPLPASRSQEKKWTGEIRRRLAEWVENCASGAVETKLMELGLPVQVRSAEENMFVEYEPLFDGYEYVRPHVLVEFGARATGEPRKVFQLKCDAAQDLPGVGFPTARAWVLSAERTFWEKATAMHVHCLQQRDRGERFSRHWYDLFRLDETGIADSAIIDRSLAESVARHKSMFFREKGASGQWIDYLAAVHGGLELVPGGSTYDALAEDYDRMLDDGMLFDGESFEEVMAGCAAIQDEANRLGSRDDPSTV